MTEQAPLKIRGFAIQLHEEMAKTADVDKGGNIIWSGSVAALFRQLGINQGYHTPIMRLLQQTDCLRQKQRGSRNIPSVYVLLRNPGAMTEAEWPSITSIVKSRPEGLTTESAGYKLLEQEIRNLAERIPPGLNLVKALTELQGQITEIKSKVTELERQINNANEDKKV